MNLNGINSLFFKPPKETPSEATNLAAIEQRVDLLLDALQIDSHAAVRNGGLPSPVARLLSQELKIQAIKEYRAITGVELKEAKDAIDSAGVAVTARQRVEHKLDLVLRELGVSPERVSGTER